MIITALFFGFLAISQADLPARVDALVNAVIDGKELAPKTWSDRLQLESVDLSRLLHTDFPDGVAYGATATKLINVPFDHVVKFFSQPGSIYRLVSGVSTLRDFHKISESNDQLRMQLAIKVPVVSDFHTETESRIYQDARGREIQIWKQVGDSPDLLYNAGAVICEAAGGKTRVFVLGIHIMKPVRKVPWLGRGTARAFAKTHYGNFVVALEKALAMN